VAYAQRELNTELRVGEARLWSGLCNPSVSLDGQPSPLESDWEQICWESDGDMDYLELEVDLSARWRVQRHLLLARADRILFLADAVLGERRAAIDYRLRLPLTGEAGFAAAKDTHEGALVCRKRRFSVLPLALPEWRAAPSAGRLTRVAEGLEFSLSAQGSALFAPLLVDLDSTRGRRPLTWRRLTVAESRQIQPPDVAVGYRAQLGRQQWLVYRSLAARGNRTLLGHNTAYEFVLARFLRTGRVEPLLQIE
jgi:hypothetical protein